MLRSAQQVFIVLAVGAVAALSACSTKSAASKTFASPQTIKTPSVMTPAKLSPSLGCPDEPGAGTSLVRGSVAGVTEYACSGSASQLLTNEDHNAQAYMDETAINNHPPTVAVIFFFASPGAKIWLADHYAGLYQPYANQPEPFAKADAILHMQPTVVGPNWAVWGNDVDVAAAAINAGGTQYRP